MLLLLPNFNRNKVIIGSAHSHRTYWILISYLKLSPFVVLLFKLKLIIDEGTIEPHQFLFDVRTTNNFITGDCPGIKQCFVCSCAWPDHESIIHGWKLKLKIWLKNLLIALFFPFIYRYRRPVYHYTLNVSPR